MLGPDPKARTRLEGDAPHLGEFGLCDWSGADPCALATPAVTENTVMGNARGGILYKQNAGGRGYGNTCSGNGGSDLSAALNPGQAEPEFSVDGCELN